LCVDPRRRGHTDTFIHVSTKSILGALLLAGSLSNAWAGPVSIDTIVDLDGFNRVTRQDEPTFATFGQTFTVGEVAVLDDFTFLLMTS